MSILVTTPTGHIGSRVVTQLLAAGADVAVYVRDAGRLAPEVRDRVRVHEGTLEDADALAAALAGVERFFLLVPPHYTVDDWRGWQRQVGQTAAAAARQAGVTRVVLLSSLGAHRSDLGPVSGVGEVEEIVRAALPHVAALRPGYFFENVLAAVPTIAGEGAIYGGFPPDLAFPHVATRDIGDVAARWLLDTGWSGHQTAGIHGPRDLTMAEVAEVAGQALGRPVRYVAVPPAGVGGALQAQGASPAVANGYVEMIEGYTRSRFERPEARTADTTTPTEFATFAAEVLRPAVEGFARAGHASADRAGAGAA